MVWEGTGGASSIASAATDTITLYINVSPDVGITGAQLRIDAGAAGTVSTFYDPVFDGISDGGSVWTLPASATYTGASLLYLGSVCCPVGGESVGNYASGFCGNGFQSGCLLWGMDLGGGLIGPFGHIGTSTLTATYTLATVTFEVVPEPATGGLLALGLGALAFIGRRRA
jgi:hypothetical protein